MASGLVCCLLLSACDDGDGASTGGATRRPAQPTTDTRTSEPPDSARSSPSPDSRLFVLPDQEASAPVDVLDAAPGRPVQVDVVRLDGGEITVDLGADGQAVLRFPHFAESAEPPRAIVRVVPRVGVEEDPLAPRTQDFRFGARFAVDAVSQGTEVDGGNNLMQRGLASDTGQYKLEVDGLRPACRIRGSDGAAEVRASQPVEPETWYRATCTRQGPLVELTIETMGAAGYTAVETVSVELPTGDVTWERRETPLSVGGKLAANGHVIKSATDQFNGLVAGVAFAIPD